MTKPIAMSTHLPFLVLILLSLLVVPTLSFRRHVITFRPQSDLSPSSLVWDPSAQHFLIASVSNPPTVAAVSDAGVLETLVQDPHLPPRSSFPSLALDFRRRRLLTVVTSIDSDSKSNCSVAAYDLRSAQPFRRIFLSSLPSDASSVAVDLSTGVAFVTAGSSGVIWKVDVNGKVSVLSSSDVYGGVGLGLDGIAHVRMGYLLAVQRATGKIFKIDADDGRARTVLVNRRIGGLEGITTRSDGSAVVIGGSSAWILHSMDGWAEAGVYDEIGIGEGRRVKGVAMREGRRLYVLYEENGGESDGVWKVEEVESEREVGGEWIGAFVMVGVGLVLFMYWRFQMRQLVTNINRKIA